MARVTSKGQVTIPVRVRQALAIDVGDDLLFEVEPGGARLRVLKRTRLSDLFGALPATRPFPGKEAVRKEVAEARGRIRQPKERPA